MENKINSGTSQGLIDFLDSVIKKGRATSGSVSPLKFASRKILTAVDGIENWQNTKIKDIDIDDYMTRFSNLTNGTYTKESLKAYKFRFEKAIRWYSKSLIEPGWVPPKNQNNKGNYPSQTIIPEKKSAENNSLANTKQQSVSEESDSPEKIDSSLVSYPFPLRKDLLVSLYLPSDLTSAEAKRLSAYIATLSMEYEEH